MQLKRAITQNVFWRSLYLASSFAVNVLISRLLSAEKTGAVYYIVNNLAFIILITSLSLESGTAYYLAKKQITPLKVATFCILYSLIASLACIFFYNYFFSSLLQTDKKILLFFYVIGVMLVSFFNGLSSALQNFRLPNVVLVSINILLILALIIFRNEPFLTLQFYYFYFGTFSLQGIVLAVVFVVNYKKEEKKDVQNSSDVLQLIFKYSLMAISANIIYFLLYRVDYWFVNKFCSSSDLGNYIQASKLGQLFLSIPSIIGASVFASVAAQTSGNPSKNVLRVSRTVLGVAFVLMMILICVGKWFFPFLFGNSFSKMYLAFVLLAPGTLAICFLYPLTAYYAGIKMIKVNIAGSSIALVIVLICDYIFIPTHGIVAAAVISSIGYATYAAYVIRYFCKQNKIPFASIVRFKH